MKISNRAFLRLATLTLALATPLAHAVSLSPHGNGQVLIYPYYTVNDGRVTQISVSNDSDHGKALRVQFREARNGRSVISFNIYLSAHDTWTGAVFSLAADGAANLVTDDASCTFPSLLEGSTLGTLPDGRHYLQFRNSSYLDDAGPHTLDRTREGTLEIFEMGSVVAGSALENALTPTAAGKPANCTYLTQAWATNGIWDKNAGADLGNPTGSLRGDASIVDIAAGRLFGYDASALEDFRTDPSDMPRGAKSSVVMHTKPTVPHPNLADALTDPATQTASADVLLRNHSIHVDYPAAHAIDAVTAALMAESIANNYILDGTVGATTQWIVAMPTRAFYTDAAIVGTTAIAPFAHTYPASGDPKQVCMPVAYQTYDRAGIKNSAASANMSLCDATEERLLQPTDFSGGQNAATFKSAGSMVWDLSGKSEATAYAMRAANDGTVFAGLPVIGFAEINFGAINAAGTSANYSSRSEHRRAVRCTNVAGKCD